MFNVPFAFQRPSFSVDQRPWRLVWGFDLNLVGRCVADAVVTFSWICVTLAQQVQAALPPATVRFGTMQPGCEGLGFDLELNVDPDSACREWIRY